MTRKFKKIKRSLGHQKKKKHGDGFQDVSSRQKALQRAMALQQTGRLPEAEALYRQMLLAEPAYAQAHINLGILLKGQDRLEEAVVSFRRALALKPDFAPLHFNLGVTLSDQGKFEDAVASYRQALALKPDFVEAYCNLGVIYREQGRLDEAVDNYKKALALRPDFVEVYCNLGVIYREQGRLDEAVANYRQALALKSDLAPVYYNLGIILNEQGRLDEAIASYRQALVLKPDFIDVYCSLGFLYRELGKMDAATECFTKALALKPDHVQAYKGLSTIERYKKEDEVIQAMEALYNKVGISVADRIDLGFSLGKVFEDIGEYEKSFGFILEANRLKRSTFEYSIQNVRDFFERIKNTFTADFISSHHGLTTGDITPIFILGLPRSGTTLVEQILASHPLVFGAGELPVMEELIDGICPEGPTAGFPECMLDLDDDMLQRLGSDYIEKVSEFSGGCKFITDKRLNNFLRLGLIGIILPGARVVHCMRDPMDNCLSIFKNDFTEIHGYAYDMEELGRYYNLYSDLIAHWQKVLPGFIHTLRYEEIIADQQGQTRRLLDFCGLPWDEACLTFYKTERRVRTASFAQVRQPIYRDSVALWKRYEKQLEPLRKAIYE